MNRISIRLLHCLGASVAALACVALSPLAAAATDATAADSTIVTAPSGEAPTTPASPEVGVLGPVVGQAGTAMATEAIKLLVGFGEPLVGRVLTVDAATQRADVLTFAPWD